MGKFLSQQVKFRYTVLTGEFQVLQRQKGNHRSYVVVTKSCNNSKHNSNDIDQNDGIVVGIHSDFQTFNMISMSLFRINVPKSNISSCKPMHAYLVKVT